MRELDEMIEGLYGVARSIVAHIAQVSRDRGRGSSKGDAYIEGWLRHAILIKDTAEFLEKLKKECGDG